ncbi:MAG TPA: glycosyltransferase family 39 protein [Candidatus Binataceae bacterium]|nr:glycosyltransferase family 39 protein [Candidatus Binataceae bacterium]
MARWIRDHRLVLCIAAAALLYLTGLGRPPLWEPDEGRYAETAREMVVGGDYITPHNNFVRYFEKPPLLYWTTAASIKLLGVNEFAVRLPAAIASVGEVAVTEVLGELMFGVMAGIMAAIALALSPLFFGFARFATPDPLLAFFVTAAMASFYMAAEAPEIGKGTGGRWMIASAALLGLGTLTKGPVALALGGAVALLWLVYEGRWRDIPRIPWLECVCVYLAITLPWFILVARRNPGFLEFFLVHEHLHRYLANTEHEWGPWFFIPITVAGTWPWLLFVPLGVKGSASIAAPSEPQDRRAIRFLLIWFGLIFVFFSIPRSKLGEYILPAIPALAMIAGRGIARTGELAEGMRRRLLAIFVAINAVMGVAAAIAILGFARYRLGAGLSHDALIAVAALLGGAMVAFWLAHARDNVPARIAAPLAIAMVIVMAAAMKAREDIAPQVSRRNLARTISPYIAGGCVLASYRHFEQSLPFYTGSRETLVDYRGELEPFGPARDPSGMVFATDAQLREIWGSTLCVILIANRQDVPTLAKSLVPVPKPIGKEGKKVALYKFSIGPETRRCRMCE